MLESLWIDKPNAENIVAGMLADPSHKTLGGYLKNFNEYGFCIIPNAVDHDIIDRYIVELEQLMSDDRLRISLGLDVVPAKGRDITIPLTKVLDTHVFSSAAQKMIFAPPLKQFLDTLFAEAPLAFQTLHFETGSTQAVHNDTAYVVLNEPKSLAASWIALEDIEPGTGELVYYPGSHRFGEFLYQNHRKNWSVDDDGHEIHDHHLHWLHEQAKERGISLETFRPKKGDALFWHADLAHGGGPITKKNSTRRSLVTHYCPARCTPHYFRFIDVQRQQKRQIEGLGYISSFYYNLQNNA